MTLIVQYEGFNFDYVSPYILDRLITDNSLQGFYRPSEDRWINVYRDAVRGTGGDYSGTERRQCIKPLPK